MSTDDPARALPEPEAPPNEATGGDVVVTNDRDHELAVVRQQIASALFPRGNSVLTQKIGRFVVERRLGAGAMGVVYAARDPALDRRVAIKLVRPEVSSDRKAQLRLEREARALAKVSHPNIVAIHEVGEHQGQVFLAMEHVQGQSLRAWQERARRSPGELLEMYMQAGRGLAAAHAAGLVHRDFKPDNVLVDDEDRARVVDFGLVSGDEAARRAELDRWVTVDALASTLVVTQTHALVGTPAYMSPEQFAGGAVDARSDQFGFCVALYEALYGSRPFAGETLPSLARATLAGVVVGPPKGTLISPKLRSVLLRGLRIDPESRWPSMQELLSELERSRHPGWRRWRKPAAVSMLGLAIALVLAVPELRELRDLEEVERLDQQARAAVSRDWKSPLETIRLLERFEGSPEAVLEAKHRAQRLEEELAARLVELADEQWERGELDQARSFYALAELYGSPRRTDRMGVNQVGLRQEDLRQRVLSTPPAWPGAPGLVWLNASIPPQAMTADYFLHSGSLPRGIRLYSQLKGKGRFRRLGGADLRVGVLFTEVDAGIYTACVVVAPRLPAQGRGEALDAITPSCREVEIGDDPQSRIIELEPSAISDP